MSLGFVHNHARAPIMYWVEIIITDIAKIVSEATLSVSLFLC